MSFNIFLRNKFISNPESNSFSFVNRYWKFKKKKIVWENVRVANRVGVDASSHRTCRNVSSVQKLTNQFSQTSRHFSLPQRICCFPVIIFLSLIAINCYLVQSEGILCALELIWSFANSGALSHSRKWKQLARNREAERIKDIYKDIILQKKKAGGMQEDNIYIYSQFKGATTNFGLLLIHISVFFPFGLIICSRKWQKFVKNSQHIFPEPNNSIYYMI